MNINYIGKKVKLTFVTVNFASNNTIASIVSKKKTVTTSSCGQIGFKGSKRSILYASQALGEKISSGLRDSHYRNIILKLKGYSRNRPSFVKGFKRNVKVTRRNKLKIRGIADFTSLPHNGCRSSNINRRKRKKLKR